jgi:prepilin-type N-terminal cleavage/methylation domain-containing protein
MRTLRRLLRCERGFTLIELVQASAILSVVLTALTVLFVQATNAELRMNERFQAQQRARVAVDRMRRHVGLDHGHASLSVPQRRWKPDHRRLRHPARE